jgi:hypothetical protein
MVVYNTEYCKYSKVTGYPARREYDLALIRYGTVVLYSCTQYSVVGTVHRNSYLSAVPVLLSLYHHTSR